MKNEYEIEGLELSKRVYLPIEFNVKCPNCQAESIVDLEQYALSYPCTGEEQEVYWCCEECDTEHKYTVKIKMSVEVDCEHTIEGA